MVVLSHIAQLYFPYLIYGDEHYIHAPWENIFAQCPFTVTYNGNSGVYIFMLIGGFVSVGVGRKINSIFGLLKKCVKRYLRLLIPISITMLLVVFLIYSNGFLYNRLDYYTFNDSIIVPSEKTIGFFAGSILAELDSMNVRIRSEKIPFIFLLLGGFCLGYPYALQDIIYTSIGSFYSKYIHTVSCASVMHLGGRFCW